MTPFYACHAIERCYVWSNTRSDSNVVCSLQDVLVVTAPGSGAEIIPFLKTWVNLPMAIGFTVLYAKVHSVPHAVHQFSKRP